MVCGCLGRARMAGGGLVRADSPRGVDAHRRRLPEDDCVRRDGGEEPVVLNKSTHASTGRSFGSPAAFTPWRVSHACAACGEPSEVLRARIWASPRPGPV